MKVELKRLGIAVVLAGMVAAGQETPLAWDAVKNFSYSIDSVSATTVTSSSWSVKVIFSVANPNPSPSFPATIWDIKTAAPITGGTLRVLIGWEATEFTNTNSRGNLNPVATGPSNIGAAMPVSLNTLSGATAAQACTVSACPELGSIPVAGRYYVTANVAPMAFPSGAALTTAIAAMEGHPICPLTGPILPGCPSTNGIATAANIPVKSVVKTVSLGGGAPAERRKIVDIAKCQQCHNDKKHGATVVPRLSLHGANRNEELKLCVICHNANQTDIPYRTSGAEVSIDFKSMIHGIHAGGFRSTPLQIVGFNGVVVDFSGVRFPAELSNCNECHVAVNRKGTYALPLSAKALGSTNSTGSTQASGNTLRTVDVDPTPDLRVTPTASVCSACHDSSSAKNHMVQTGGASFSTLQSNIIPGVTEKCVNCHGRGKPEDVRRVHEIGFDR